MPHQNRVTAESPKGPDCQSMKMDWLIYVFANFSSKSLVATRNNGLTLQTWNCHLHVTFSPFIYSIFFCVFLTSQWDPQIGDKSIGRVWRVPSAKCKLVLQLCRKWTSHNGSSHLRHPHVFILTCKASALQMEKPVWSLSGKHQQWHLLWQTSLGGEQRQTSFAQVSR